MVYVGTGLIGITVFTQGAGQFYFLPPYVIEESEIHFMVDTYFESINEYWLKFKNHRYNLKHRVKVHKLAYV